MTQKTPSKSFCLQRLKQMLPGINIDMVYFTNPSTATFKLSNKLTGESKFITVDPIEKIENEALKFRNRLTHG